ncbi:hypothetical protein [Roseicyclus mahoneyensis]|uniref:hypothetical protein n=1 Tax=Roseicyclus mahoneyensis TaxID=164332 RepID=UPI001FEBD1A1|nr:hypothetical protein [Roseicyclus mahoneyensis]
MDVEKVRTLADHVIGLPSRAIVAIDGVDGAGKTTFADSLAALLTECGRPILRAGVDGFHNPADVRYARGRRDPTGYFLDSYDYPALIEHLIIPFRRGDSHVLTAIFDHRRDAADRSGQIVPPGALLILDGIFLHRDELSDLWDFSVFLSVPFDVSFERMARRDGCDPDPKAPANARYLEGQLLYHAQCMPETRADLVIEDW